MWTTALCLAAAVLWPGQSLSARFQSVLFGVLSIAIGYGFFRLFLGAVASLASQWAGRLAFWYIAFVLYIGIFGPLLALATLPFQWHELFDDEMTFPMFIASFPTGISASLAAARVIDKHYLEV
jgi:hypothetical protein